MSSILIQVKRGKEEYIPILREGELGFTLDTHKVFIGDGSRNHEVLTQSSLDGLSDFVKVDGSIPMTGSLTIGNVETIDKFKLSIQSKDYNSGAYDNAESKIELIGNNTLLFATKPYTDEENYHDMIGAGFECSDYNNRFTLFVCSPDQYYPQSIFSFTLEDPATTSFQQPVNFSEDVSFMGNYATNSKMKIKEFNTTSTYLYLYASNGELFDITVNRNHYIRFQYFYTGQVFYVLLRGGGNRTLHWYYNGYSDRVHWAGGTEPEWSTGIDLAAFAVIADNYMVGSRIMENIN